MTKFRYNLLNKMIMYNKVRLTDIMFNSATPNFERRLKNGCY